MKFREIKRKLGSSLTGEQKILALFGLLAVCVGIVVTGVWGMETAKEVREIKKPEAGGEPVQERLFIEAGQEGARSYVVEVPARLYGAAEAKRLLEKGREELDRRLLGENDSPDHVISGLYLAAEAADGRVAVEWSIDHPEYLSYGGVPAEDLPPEGVPVRLEARLSCQ